MTDADIAYIHRRLDRLELRLEDAIRMQQRRPIIPLALRLAAGIVWALTLTVASLPWILVAVGQMALGDPAAEDTLAKCPVLRWFNRTSR